MIGSSKGTRVSKKARDRTYIHSAVFLVISFL